MKGLFVESKLFEKLRQNYLTDDEYQMLQDVLLLNPKAGDVIKSTSGLRKIRSSAKGKGKRSGVRVIYFYFDRLKRFYLLTLYAKNEVMDLSTDEKRQLKSFVETWKNEQT